MKTKKIFYTEVAYLLGVLLLALGTAFMVQADFGISMVVAPAYLLHLKLSAFLPWFTFGMSEYVLQAILLIILSCVLRKFKKSYVFSFVTAVFYGFSLDFFLYLIDFLPASGLVLRLVYYCVGLLVGSLSIALLFRTYLPPEAYELFVKELAEKTGRRIDRVKTVYDCCSCLVGILLSFAFFGLWHFEGIHFGTLVCALINGWLIGRISRIYDRHFTFQDALPFRKFFEK